MHRRRAIFQVSCMHTKVNPEGLGNLKFGGEFSKLAWLILKTINNPSLDFSLQQQEATLYTTQR